MMTTHILLVEDDTVIAALVTASLQRAGYRVTFVGGALKALTVLETDPPDLILLDVMLPTMSGLQFTKKVRLKQDIPIIMLTAMSETEDKVACFQAGADDYLTKPFVTSELLARIAAVMRRATVSGFRPKAVLYNFAGWVLNPISRELSNPDCVRIVLTGAEFDLLRVLCSHAGQVMSRDKLMSLSQGRQVEPYDRSVDTLISRIRQKIELEPDSPDMIKTIRNGGYVFAPTVQEVPL